MKANELRVNNYVSKSNAPFKDGDSVVKINPFNLSQFESFAPIELTEECLLKFGFTKDDNILIRSFRKAIASNGAFSKELILNLDSMNQYIFIKESYVGLLEKSEVMIALFNQDFSNHPIYVHQLQNIWFQLKEEELIIK